MNKLSNNILISKLSLEILDWPQIKLELIIKRKKEKLHLNSQYYKLFMLKNIKIGNKLLFKPLKLVKLILIIKFKETGDKLLKNKI